MNMKKDFCEDKDMSRKKIVVIFPKDSESIFNNKKKTFGGATVQLFNYAVELSKTNEVHCLINEASDIDPNDFSCFNIHFTFSRKDNYLKKIITFHKVLRKIKPDVVIQRGLTRISTLLAIHCRVFRARMIFMFAHDRECRGRFQRSGRLNSFYPLLLVFAKHLIVQNDYQFSKIPGIFKKKLCKISNGYPINLPDESSKSGVLWVSRLEPWKRPEACIYMAVKNPDIQFTMIAPVDEKNKEYAEQIYKMAQNVRNITILDFVCFNEIDLYFQRARIFLNTSTEEGFPNTFIQACKNKTPIVSLSVNPDDFITKFNVGRFCDDNLDNLRESLSEITKNEDLWENYAKSAVEYVSRFHCIEKNTQILNSLFLSV